MSSRTGRFDNPNAGFSLIEVLVAVAVIAVVLGAIGSVIAATVKGTQSIDEKLSLIQAAHRMLATLPERETLQVGSSQTGVSGNYRWRMDVRPLAAPPPTDSKDPNRWLPLAIALRVQAPRGPVLRLDTIRLVRRPSE